MPQDSKNTKGADNSNSHGGTASNPQDRLNGIPATYPSDILNNSTLNATVQAFTPSHPFIIPHPAVYGAPQYYMPTGYMPVENNYSMDNSNVEGSTSVHPHYDVNNGIAYPVPGYHYAHAGLQNPASVPLLPGPGPPVYSGQPYHPHGYPNMYYDCYPPDGELCMLQPCIL